MNKQELIERIKDYPDDALIKIYCEKCGCDEITISFEAGESGLRKGKMMEKLTSGKWWMEVLYRDVKTAASVALAGIGQNALIGAVDWKTIASMVALTFITNTLLNVAMLPDPEEEKESVN